MALGDTLFNTVVASMLLMFPCLCSCADVRCSHCILMDACLLTALLACATHEMNSSGQSKAELLAYMKQEL